MNNLSLTPAATVLLVRDCGDELEVLMVKRSKRPPFGNLYVFPGGKIDESDKDLNITNFCNGLNDEQASIKLGINEGGLSYWVACVRECFEEVGILLAIKNNGFKNIDKQSLFNSFITPVNFPTRGHMLNFSLNKLCLMGFCLDTIKRVFGLRDFFAFHLEISHMCVILEFPESPKNQKTWNLPMSGQKSRISHICLFSGLSQRLFESPRTTILSIRDADRCGPLVTDIENPT